MLYNILIVREQYIIIIFIYSVTNDSYNAYKHGYRLWVGKDQSNYIESAIFRNRKGLENHIPLDDQSLNLVIKSGTYCLYLFDIQVKS